MPPGGQNKLALKELKVKAKVTTWCQLERPKNVPRIIHAKHQCHIFNTSEDMSQVNIFVTDRGTDRQINRRTDEWVIMPPPNFAKVRGQNSVVFWPNEMLIGSFACRAPIDWFLSEFIVRYDWSDPFCRWWIFSPIQYF